MSDFSYIVDKIKSSEFTEAPFPHLDIQDLLSSEHLNHIRNDPQINFPEASTNDELAKEFIQHSYGPAGQAGCVTSWKLYKKFLLKDKSVDPSLAQTGVAANAACIESAGMGFRLTGRNAKNPLVKELLGFMNGEEWHTALREKFGITRETKAFTAIQKYLSGYEISPHADLRSKCLTYLVNINTDAGLERQDIHTHLLEFKDEYKKVQEYWLKNKNHQRHWVPWDCCNTVKKMSKNNSMVIFSPASSPPTLHGVKLDYNHKKSQRTQLYGNLNYKGGGGAKNLPIDWLLRIMDERPMIE